ncbi:two-component system phosphate regulon sensor histidine kinase PhoR [Litoreibacter ponti]|uniref:histidine kinase n=1 Tax=Litoreibacter ponti TaxID=1510457 RepID=A0A2T6BIX9_9RHOB|nr:ATP-binding protein [Litoreibacter ponti]PTX56015.1 two-component system phosphate regulon sensor histidine kinase PhoR [Litoreibacter ponti]
MDESAILAGIPLPVLLVAPDYAVTRTNPASLEMFGHDPVGQNAVSLLRQAPVLAALDGAMRDRQPGHARFLLSGLSGEVSYEMRAHPMDGGGAVVSFEDRSHREESELMRRDFIANISHELRTPLTGLIGFIETLRGPAKDDAAAQERFLAIMADEAQRMSRMVSDLLSLSRVEVDERVRPRAEVGVEAVLRSVLATLEGKLQEANVGVETEGLTLAAPIRGDSDQLIQLFINLIENAIKYGGPEKTIHVSLSLIERDPTLRQPAVRVDIRDEGPGIDPIHIPRLTERFYRIDDDRSRAKGGTGLGLAIVKHIVNRHRGRLKITSDQGVGSVFSVIFPQG